MSYDSGRGIGACFAITFGLLIAFMGLIFTFTLAEISEGLTIISYLLLVGGLILFLGGLSLVPGARKEYAKRQSILRIAGVRKEVSISDLSYETGLDPEYIREILTSFLISGFLFGYIEGDLFVRDTAGGSRYPRHQSGLFNHGN